MNKILSGIFFLTFLASCSMAQNTSDCMHKIHFFSREVISRGAAQDQEIRINENKPSIKKEYPSTFQYFLFMENDCCGKIRIQSITIDGVPYTTEIKKTTAPVPVPNAPMGGEENFIKESTFDIYQLVITRLREAKPVLRTDVKHQLIVEGKIGSKTFLIKQTAVAIRALVAM